MTISNTQIKMILSHGGAIISASLATLLWTASHGVDLYAIVDQVNTVVADVTKLALSVSTFAAAAYGVYRTALKPLLNDVAAQPEVKGIVTTPAVAMAVPSEKVVATPAEVRP